MRNILVADFGLPFDLRTPYFNPIGGSEISALLIARGLSELGNPTVLLTTENSSNEHNNNLTRDNVNNFIPYANGADVIILNRHIPQEIQPFLENKEIYLYSHDNWDQQNVQWMLNKNSSGKIKIICVSEYQKETFVRYFNRDPEEFMVLGNPIDMSLYTSGITDNKKDLVFASIPFKGLEIIKDIFDEVCIRTEMDDLNLHVYSSMNLYQRPEENQQYANHFMDLANTKNVILYDPIPMSELAQVLRNSAILLSPCTYQETFGRVYIEAMASGCIPVAVNNGASLEVIGNENLVTKGMNIFNKDVFNEYVDIVSNLLTMDDPQYYKLRLGLPEKAKNWNYLKLAKKLDEQFTCKRKENNG